jgi:hypothetical protein
LLECGEVVHKQLAFGRFDAPKLTIFAQRPLFGWRHFLKKCIFCKPSSAAAHERPPALSRRLLAYALAGNRRQRQGETEESSRACAIS